MSNYNPVLDPIQLSKNHHFLKLKYFCEVKDGTHDTPAYVENEENTYPLVTSKDVNNGILSFENAKHISKEDYLAINRRSNVERYDVIMPMIGTIGNPAIVDTDKKFSIKNVALFKTNNDLIKAKYLKYLLSSQIVQKQLAFLNRGGVQSFVSLGILENISITITDDLNKIVAYLDSKTSSINELIASKVKLINLLEEKRQSLITEAVTKGLNPNVKMKDSGVEWIGKVPEHWQIKKFKRCFKIFNGKEITNELDIEDENGIDVFGSGGKFKKTDEFIYDGKSVLFGRKGTIGKPLYVNRKFWTVDTMYFTKFHKESYPKWFYYVLKVYPWHLIMTQTALPSIVGSDIENDYWCIPPYKEQQEITFHLDQLNDKTDNLILNINKQISNLKAYSESLIYEAVTGKIDVREFETAQ